MRSKYLCSAILICVSCLVTGASEKQFGTKSRIVIDRAPAPQTDEARVGSAQNVFVGKVLRKQGVHWNRRQIPLTRFEVEVVENIKGDMPRKVFIDQIGGAKRRMLIDVVQVEPTGGQLSIGCTYALFTRTTAEKAKKNIHHASPFPNENILISTNVALNVTELKRVAQTYPSVVRLREAYRSTKSQPTLEKQ